MVTSVDGPQRVDSDIIFLSDDLAATAHVSQRILSAWKEGWLDGFSIIANGEAWDLVRESLNATQKPARISVHLNLCEGPPLAASRETSLITDANGMLNLTFGGLILARLTWSGERFSTLLTQIEREWREQIQFVKKSCAPREIAAVDGHLHLHMLPFLFPIAARLARENGIREIRISQEVFLLSSRQSETVRPFFAMNLIKRTVLQICSRFALPVARREGLLYPDSLVGILYTHHMTSSSAQAGILAARKRGARRIEVLFHVGRAEPREKARWNSAPSIGRDYMASGRDQEWLELKKLRESFSRSPAEYRKG